MGKNEKRNEVEDGVVTYFSPREEKEPMTTTTTTTTTPWAYRYNRHRNAASMMRASSSSSSRVAPVASSRRCYEALNDNRNGQNGFQITTTTTTTKATGAPTNVCARRERRRRRRRNGRMKSSGDAVNAVTPENARERGWGPTRQEIETIEEDLEFDSLDRVGWFELLTFVGEYTSTALGKARLSSNEGKSLISEVYSQEMSEMLLDETESAMYMESVAGVSLDFGGMLTIETKRSVHKASQGAPLGGDELIAVAIFLENARRLKLSIENVSHEDNETGEIEVPRAMVPLRNIAMQMETFSEVVDIIKSKVDDTGSFKDTASPELRRARERLLGKETQLKELLSRMPGSAVSFRGRMCLAVSPESAPKNALVLGTQSGLTLIEPPSVVNLNTELAKARDDEESAIDGIRRELSRVIMEVAEEILRCLELTIDLDIIAARCRHGQALNSVRPTFASESVLEDAIEERLREKAARNEMNDGYDENNKDEKQENLSTKNAFVQAELEIAKSKVYLPGLRQPVLASQAVKAVKDKRREAAEREKRKEEEEEEDDTSSQPRFKIATRESKKKKSKKLQNELNSQDHFDFDFDDGFDWLYDGKNEDGSDANTFRVKGPVPVDVFVEARTKCVVITGPNTGGKTAAMKALGLSALMARAGMFVPAERAHLPWFDYVLCDIGDDQDLLTNLSTFSARLTTQKAILKRATPQSLVLIDEVGTGTSPLEGAAIARALLKALAGLLPGRLGVSLAFATTHHGSLKALKYEHKDSGAFENAAVEFDEAELRPTYRLLWAVPGRSRALQIAERNKLDEDVIDLAKEVMGQSFATLDDVIAELEGARKDADKAFAKAMQMLKDVENRIPQARNAEQTVLRVKEDIAMKQATTILRISREAKIRIQGEERLKRQELSANTKKSMISKSAAGETDREREIRLAKERKVAAANGGEVAEETNQELTEMPRVGDKVILKTSGLAGKVTKVSDEIVTVAAGFIVAEAKLNELWKPSPSSPSSVKTSSSQTFAGVKKKPASPSRAAREFDALLGSEKNSSSSDGRRVSVEDYDAWDNEPSKLAQIGDSVQILKNNFKGKVVEDEDGMLTIQAGPTRMVAPSHGVKVTKKASNGSAIGAGAVNVPRSTMSKKKKKKKQSAFPSGTNITTNAPPAVPKKEEASIEDLIKKFGK